MHQLHGLNHALDPDAVAHEVGGVLGPDDALAENAFAEIRHEAEDFLIGFLSGNDLQQVHVAHRVEKVGPRKCLRKSSLSPSDMALSGMPEVLEETMVPAFRTLSMRAKRSCLIFRFSTTTSTIQSQSASLSKSSSRLPMEIQPDILSSASAVAGLMPASKDYHTPALTIRLRALGSGFFFLFGQIKGNNVQHQRLDSCTGQQRGNPAAHDTGADDRGLSDLSNRTDERLLVRLIPRPPCAG
jgi:hypothetical protein